MRRLDELARHEVVPRADRLSARRETGRLLEEKRRRERRLRGARASPSTRPSNEQSWIRLEVRRERPRRTRAATESRPGSTSPRRRPSCDPPPPAPPPGAAPRRRRSPCRARRPAHPRRRRRRSRPTSVPWRADAARSARRFRGGPGSRSSRHHSGSANDVVPAYRPTNGGDRSVNGGFQTEWRIQTFGSTCVPMPSRTSSGASIPGTT